NSLGDRRSAWAIFPTIRRSSGFDGLALICAERTRERRRFQSSGAPRVLLSPGGARRELKPPTQGCAELRRKSEGRLIADPRLLISGPKVRFFCCPQKITAHTVHRTH